MGPRHCANCGKGASKGARFCERCGTALTASAEPLRAPSVLEAKILNARSGIEGERKQVTVMYTDIVGSMALTRSLDTERYGYVLDRFLAIAAAAVHKFEGTVNQFTGDGLLAVFGAPLAHEDHAQRACLAVLELQSAVSEMAAELARSDGVDFGVRCGVNSGEVVVGAIGDDVHMDFVPIGHTTALGKRIESQAPVGSTAISATTAALIEGEFELRDLGEFEVKGLDEPQRVLELVGLGAARTRLEAAAVTRGYRGSSVASRRAPRWRRHSTTRWLGMDGRWESSATPAWARAAWCASSSPDARRAEWWSTRAAVSLTDGMSRSSPCLRCTATTSASASATRPRSPASGSGARC